MVIVIQYIAYSIYIYIECISYTVCTVYSVCAVSVVSSVSILLSHLDDWEDIFMRIYAPQCHHPSEDSSWSTYPSLPFNKALLRETNG